MNLETARTIVATALAFGRERNLAPLTVVVLDAGGHITAVEREDGCSNKRFEIAYGKAHGAISLGMGSRALGERAEAQPYFIAAATHSVGALIPVPGAVLLLDDTGVIVGAVGISGDTSDNDEAACIAGAAAAGLTAKAD
jgi:uncharacterized protein GlcG (DUF336 family)